MTDKAIVLAAFGASLPEALPGISNIVERVRSVFHCPVEVCFTSNLVRSVWQKRLAGEGWLAEHPETPEYVRRVQGPLATMTALQDKGFQNQLVQPLHIYAGEEYHDLRNTVAALAGIETIKAKWRPFKKLALGRPALGAPGVEHPYLQDIQRAAEALRDDVQQAHQQEAALVYVGHGNHVFSTGVYHELQRVLQRRHPGLTVAIGTVEGIFDAAYVSEYLHQQGVRRVLLKPLMVVAGVHARDDMAGEGEDSWRSVLIRAGFEVDCRLRGLGENDAWADLYLRHILESAAQAGIEMPSEVKLNE